MKREIYYVITDDDDGCETHLFGTKAEMNAKLLKIMEPTRQLTQPTDIEEAFDEWRDTARFGNYYYFGSEEVEIPDSQVPSSAKIPTFHDEGNTDAMGNVFSDADEGL